MMLPSTRKNGGSSKATGAPARFAPRYCFADIVAVDSDIITLLGPDGAAAVLHGSPRERRDGFLRAVAAAVPPDPTDSDLLAALPSEVLYSVVRGRQR